MYLVGLDAKTREKFAGLLVRMPCIRRWDRFRPELHVPAQPGDAWPLGIVIVDGSVQRECDVWVIAPEGSHEHDRAIVLPNGRIGSERGGAVSSARPALPSGVWKTNAEPGGLSLLCFRTEPAPHSN